jgi:hypothetical protein
MLVSTFAVPVYASTGHPHIIINDPVVCNTMNSAPVGLSFTFKSDALGGGTLCFENTSGVDWFNLEIDVPVPNPANGHIYCGSNVFSLCYRQSLVEANFATIDFFKIGGDSGIPNGTFFYADMGTTDWTPNATFFAFANETDEPEPEPGTAFLLLTGIAPLLARRLFC